MWHTLWQTLNNWSKISWLNTFLRTQSSDRGLSAKNHFQSYRTKIDFCHSVRLCVLYIRAAAAARDRVAAVVGAWPNIWLRHHQTRYFFFSISLWKPEGEKLVWWADPLHRHLIQWWPTLRFKPRSRSLTVFSSPQCWKINQKVSHNLVILKMSHFECFN